MQLIAKSGDVLADQLGHVEHADLSLAIEDDLHGGVGIDHALVLFVLKTVLLDISPELLGELCAGQWIGTDDGGKRGIRLNRLHESGVRFASRFFSHSGNGHRIGRGQCNDFFGGRIRFLAVDSLGFFLAVSLLSVSFGPVAYPALPPLIETPRLILRPFALSDSPAVQHLAGMREISDTTLLIPHPYPEGAADAWIGTHAMRWTSHEELTLAITLRVTGDLIGAVSFALTPAHDRAELGYWIGLPFWRQGFATEATGALTDFGFKVLGLNRVQAHHLARNSVSGRVLLKLGMRREGTSTRAVKKNGRYEDVLFYGILRRDWPGCSSALPFPAA